MCRGVLSGGRRLGRKRCFVVRKAYPESNLQRMPNDIASLLPTSFFDAWVVWGRKSTNGIGRISSVLERYLRTTYNKSATDFWAVGSRLVYNRAFSLHRYRGQATSDGTKEQRKMHFNPTLTHKRVPIFLALDMHNGHLACVS